MRDLAAAASLVLLLAGLYAVAAPAGHTIQTALADAAVTLTATR